MSSNIQIEILPFLNETIKYCHCRMKQHRGHPGDRFGTSLKAITGTSCLLRICLMQCPKRLPRQKLRTQSLRVGFTIEWVLRNPIASIQLMLLDLGCKPLIRVNDAHHSVQCDNCTVSHDLVERTTGIVSTSILQTDTTPCCCVISPRIYKRQ